MASITWEPSVSKIVYGELIEESIFSARAIYQDADGDDYSPDGTYVYTYSGTTSGTLTAGKKLGAGSYTLTVTFDPTDDSLGGSITGTASLTVEKSTPVVTWNNPSDITYALYDNGLGGSVGPKLSDEQLNAKADVAGAFTYAPVKDTELDAGEQTVTAAFVPTDTTNYKSLSSSVKFEVLKGEIKVVWPVFENGVCQEIRRKGRDPEIIPYELKYKAEDGTGEGLSRPKFLSIFKENPAGTFQAEVPGSITFDPRENSELCEKEDLVADFGAPPEEGKFITAVFKPSKPQNWKGLVNGKGESGKENSTLLIARHQFAIYKRVSGPNIAPTIFGCWVQSVSASVGWGGTSSTCSLRLVEDPKNDFKWTPPEDSNGDVQVGAACYFQYKGFYFGGVFTRWSYGDSVSGRYYDIILESPAKLLDGVEVVMDSFEGTEYNFDEGGQYNRFRPSTQNPNITTEVNNVYNALGHFENYTFGGIFGAADTNSVGFPANKLLETIELLSCPFENPEADFAHKCVFGEQEYFKIDLSDINDIAPEYYRISGVNQNVNGIISDVTELVQYDYFITLEKDPNEGKLEAPVLVMGAEGKAVETAGLSESDLSDLWKEGDDGGGLITNPNIKVVAIDKTSQPSPGIIRSLVNDFKKEDILMSSSIGQELQDNTTQKLVIGGPASRLVTRDVQIAYPIWAKRSDSSYRFDRYLGNTSQSYFMRRSYSVFDKRIPIFLDPYTPTDYYATIFELRMATAGKSSWQTYKVFESVKNDEYDNPQKAPWAVDIDIDVGTLEVLAAGNRGALSMASTKPVTASKAFDPDYAQNFSRNAARYTDRLFQAVAATANTFYGKMFLIRMPEEPGGQDNNLRYITEDQKWETSWDATDSAFDPAKRFSDVAMFDASGRTKTYVEWKYDYLRDFSGLGSDYAGYTGDMYLQNSDTKGTVTPGGKGVATAGCSIDKSAIFYEVAGENRPFVVMDAGNQVFEYDDMTTPDFGLTVLAQYFFDIYVPPRNYIGPGKPNTRITIPPKVIPPRSFGVAQQSNRYAWGPWYGGSLKGKTEVLSDESLVPETFGSVDGMNQSGESIASVGNAEMSGSETG